MAQDSQEGFSEELSAASRMAFAVRAIESDANLRWFLRQFFSFCHVIPQSGVFDLDPRQNAYNQGVQAAGMELARMLTSAAPLLMPALLIEEMREDATE